MNTRKTMIEIYEHNRTCGHGDTIDQYTVCHYPFDNMDNFYDLSAWYTSYVELFELPNISADELLAELPNDHPQCKTVHAFIDRWDACDTVWHDNNIAPVE